MFEHFTFAQKRVRSGVAPDPDQSISPKDVPTDWSASSVAPAKLAHSSTASLSDHTRSHGDYHRLQHNGPEPIDGLINQMSRQTLLPPLQNHFANYNCGPTSEPTPAPTAGGWCDPFSHDSDGIDPRRPRGLAVSDIDPTSAPDDSFALPQLTAGRRLPPWSDPRLHGHNPRAVREALMEIMITQGVQCNIRPSSPPSSASQPSFPTLEARSPDEMRDDPLGSSSFEIDPDCGSQEDTEALLRSYVKLRSVGSSGAMRKANGLRYCSSAEAALKSKNLKRNKIKMRKRDNKPKPHVSVPPPSEMPVGITSV